MVGHGGLRPMTSTELRAELTRIMIERATAIASATGYSVESVIEQVSHDAIAAVTDAYANSWPLTNEG